MASPLSVDGRRRLRLRHGLRDGSAHVRREVIFTSPINFVCMRSTNGRTMPHTNLETPVRML